MTALWQIDYFVLTQRGGQATEEILLRFGQSREEALRSYEAFIAEGITLGKRPDLIGGGLVRSAGGWEAVLSAHRAGVFLKSDERILGDSDFVLSLLDTADEHLERKSRLRMEGMDLVHSRGQIWTWERAMSSSDRTQ